MRLIKFQGVARAGANLQAVPGHARQGLADQVRHRHGGHAFHVPGVKGAQQGRLFTHNGRGRLLFQVRQEGLDHPQGTVQVDFYLIAKPIPRAGGALQVYFSHHPGVVHHHVQSRKAPGQHLGQAPYSLGVAGVAFKDPQLRQPLLGRLQPRQTASGDQHRVAQPDQLVGHFQANAAGAARDKYRVAADPHRHPPRVARRHATAPRHPTQTGRR